MSEEESQDGESVNIMLGQPLVLPTREEEEEEADRPTVGRESRSDMLARLLNAIREDQLRGFLAFYAELEPIVQDPDQGDRCSGSVAAAWYD